MDENYKNPSSNSRPLLHSFPTTRSTLFKKINVWLLLLQLVLFLCPVSSFLSNKQAGPSSSPSLADGWCSWRRWHLYSQTSQGDGADINSLRVSVIRSELKELGVNFSDCFDKESLVQRLKDAREQKHAQGVSTSSSSSPEPSTSDTSNNSESDRSTDETSLLQEIRSMSVRDLRQDLASRNLRWAGLLEKEDLVQAVLKARKEALNFAVTGFAPGSVATLTGDEATAEIFSQGVSSPLLLDVYAVWCGPCQMMAPQLQEVALELGNRVRVAKMDSDKYPEVAGTLRVQGLPTLILFNKDGVEVNRIEGAMMKNQLIQWIEENV